MSDSQGLDHLKHQFDVCVVGGGMAGLCAAIASARNGARTVVVQDRPMFGGNASSEVRMWVCGAHGSHNKETGILEEIQLENLYRNPGLVYGVWDTVMWEKARFQPNLELMLNCSINGADVEAGVIRSVTGWQLTTQTWHTIEAAVFIDCSGDSILAPLSGAACRWGREAREEFDEDIEPATADGRTMGHSLLIQIARCQTPQPFTPPRWAFRFDRPEEFVGRLKGVHPHNFWWLELGGINDTIRDTEAVRDDLLRAAYGVWDYIKNRAPEREKAANWAIHWIGMLPGKRENRRYEGDYIMHQPDVEAGGAFDDVVAYGGWSMDDHHPAGLLYPGRPTIHHKAPSPYGIPYRCLYSRDVENLMFAGRNISVTHAALSSTRVMATCAVIGQAAGTAAALAHRHGVTPRGVHERRLRELQSTLMEDDCFLPGLRRDADPLSADARLDGEGEGVHRLIDGFDRDRPDAPHAWEAAVGSAVTYTWPSPVHVGGVRLVFDSNLDNDKRMPCAYPVRGDRVAVPDSLVKAYRIEALEESGRWRTVHRARANHQRLVRAPVNVRATAVRFVPEATWGGGEAPARVFSFEATAEHLAKIPEPPEGPRFADVRAACAPTDLAPPAKDEQAGPKPAHTA